MRKKTWLWAGVGLIMLGVTLGVMGQGDLGASAAVTATPTVPALEDPVLGSFDPERVADIDLMALPVVPSISENALAIFQAGVAGGRGVQAFAKVGDCMTDNEYFLRPIGTGEYDLSAHDGLQPVIDLYAGASIDPFSRLSQASAGGFNAASVLDSMWANPEFCEAGETPLACEFSVMNPSVALIMFGTNDVQYLSDEQFDYFLRGVIVETIRQGTLPVLSTFPYRPDFPEQSEYYNKIVAQIAADYDIPLINLWRALEPLADHGVDREDPTHLSTPQEASAADFSSNGLEYGFPVRNLLTLQTLDALLQAAEVPELAE